MNVKDLIEKFESQKQSIDELRKNEKLRQQSIDERRLKKRELKRRGKGDQYNPLHKVKSIVGVRHSKIDGNYIFKVEWHSYKIGKEEAAT